LLLSLGISLKLMNRSSFIFLLFLFQLLYMAPAKSQRADSTIIALDAAIKAGQELPDSAFVLLKKIQATAVAEKDQATEGKALQEMGRLCYRLGHYSKALEYYQEAEDIFTTYALKKEQASVANDMGQLHYRNINKMLSKGYHDRALLLYTALRDTTGIAETYGNIGHYYEKLSMYDSAFYFQRLAQQYYLRIDDHEGMAGIYQYLGTIYEDLGQYDSARFYFNSALKLGVGNDKPLSAELINNIGDILRKTGAYNEALPYSHQALAMARTGNNKYQEASACKDIAQIYHLLNNNDSAYYYMEQSRKILLAIYSEENNQQMNFLQTLYNVNKKDHEILTLENKHKVNKILFSGIVVIVILVVIVCLLTISRQRLKISQEKSNSEQKEEVNRSQKEQLDVKSKQLANHTLDIIQRNHFLDDLRVSLTTLVNDEKRDQKKQLQQLVLKINQNVNHEKQWQDFTGIFEQVHQVFFDKLTSRYHGLTNNDVRLLALHKINMGSKDMAMILRISPDSLRVSRYRLRKKLQLPEDVTLYSFTQQL